MHPRALVALSLPIVLALGACKDRNFDDASDVSKAGFSMTQTERQAAISEFASNPAAKAEVQIAGWNDNPLIRVKNPHPFFNSANPDLSKVLPMFTLSMDARNTDLLSWVPLFGGAASSKDLVAFIPYSGSKTNHLAERQAPPREDTPEARELRDAFYQTIDLRAYSGGWKVVATDNLAWANYQNRDARLRVRITNHYEVNSHLSEAPQQQFEISMTHDGFFKNKAGQRVPRRSTTDQTSVNPDALQWISMDLVPLH